MVKKQKMSADKKSAPPLSGSVKESAQQIWLAGLGAFSRAQEEGGKVFESLVKEGLSIQRKTKTAAEEKIAEATSKMAHMAGEMQSRAGHQWDKLENIFEDRVAKALTKLGVPSAQEMDALKARIEELTQRLHKMNGKPPAKTGTKTTAKSNAKSTAKTSAPKPAKPATKKAAKPAAVKRPGARKAVSSPTTPLPPVL